VLIAVGIVCSSSGSAEQLNMGWSEVHVTAAQLMHKCATFFSLDAASTCVMGVLLTGDWAWQRDKLRQFCND